MSTKVLSRVLPRATSNRKKQKVQLKEEEIDFLISNTTHDKENLEDRYRNFLGCHANGQISKKSFNIMLKESYPGTKTRKVSRHVFRMYDTNGDGSVDFKEFTLALDVLANGTPEQNLKQIFRVFDINNDGKINVMEIVEIVKDIFELTKQISHNITEDENTLAGAAFAEMDLNADGEITEEEFVKACLAQKKFSTIVTLKIIDLFLS